MIQICSGMTSGRVLNGEPHAQRLEKLIYWHLEIPWIVIAKQCHPIAKRSLILIISLVYTNAS